MRRLGQFICLSFLVLTFSCDSDALFDDNNPDALLVGEWDVVSIAVSYTHLTLPTTPYV